MPRVRGGLLLSVLAAATAGCGGQPWFDRPETIQIESNPPGARVQINGKEVGKTPMTATITRGGTYGMPNDLNITAIPGDSGCPQVRMVTLARTPKEIDFDMNRCPP